VQNKVLEALACGTPVIATPGAIQALQAVVGDDLLEADSPDSFAEQILRTITDAGLRLRLAEAGRRYVERCHNWDTLAEALSTVYQEAIVTAGA
jgi:glycosyltransferase involved in cell wall biosynthesis